MLRHTQGAAGEGLPSEVPAGTAEDDRRPTRRTPCCRRSSGEPGSEGHRRALVASVLLHPHIALNLLKAVPGALNGKKLGVKNKRLLAGWHDRHLLRVLGVMS